MIVMWDPVEVTNRLIGQVRQLGTSMFWLSSLHVGCLKPLQAMWMLI